MSLPLFKLCAPLALCAAISACGGGGSESSGDTGNGGNNLPTSSEITADNFVVVASSAYLLVTVKTVAAELLPGLNLVLLEFTNDATAMDNCSVSGSQDYLFTRSDFDSLSLMQGDGVLTNYQNCETLSDRKSGSTNAVLESVTGEFNSLQNDYSSRVKYTEDYETTDADDASDNGQTRSEYTWYSATDYNNDLSYGAVNLHDLYAVTSPQATHPFYSYIDAQLAHARDYTPVSNDPSADFDVLAFERVSYGGDQPRSTYQWSVDVDFPQGDYADFVSTTMTPLIIEERSVGDDSVFFAEGTWQIIYGGGDTILLTSTFSQGVTLTLDLGGDGSIEATQTMSWQEFVDSLFGALINP